MTHVITRIAFSLAVTSIVAIGTVELWQTLQNDRREQIARIAESESYAARSQLVRNFERVISALRSAGVFWATYGRQPRQFWSGEVDIEMARIPGITTILWDDPDENIRFARTVDNPVFDFRPDTAQWASYEQTLARARETTNDTMAGPFQDEQGRPYFEIYLASESGRGNGRLIAIIDARKNLGNLLLDESPGYAVQVFWRDVLLYGRDEPATDIPGNWIRDGTIQSTLDSYWRVVHAPTNELVASYKSRAIDLVLVLGLITAVLMGTLTFETWRAHSRAREAEMAEQNLAALNRNLEQLVEIRTRELADRNADLQTISDSVAHDLRNPLSSIAMNVDLAAAQSDEELHPGIEKALRRVEPAIRQMADILDRMVGLSTVAHTTFQREPVDMLELVNEVFEDLNVNEPPPAVTFEVGDLPTIEADEVLVSILWTNLISNALKYTRNREHRLVRVDHETVDGIDVFSITDNGIGLDESSAKKLFQAFHRGEGRRMAEGLGLGLTLVSRVVKSHDGMIRVEGEKDRYAKFSFTLQPNNGFKHPA